MSVVSVSRQSSGVEWRLRGRSPEGDMSDIADHMLVGVSGEAVVETPIVFCFHVQGLLLAAGV